jgi:hypothetical protein
MRPQDHKTYIYKINSSSKNSKKEKIYIKNNEEVS